jgi:hypothetical protein
MHHIPPKTLDHIYSVIEAASLEELRDLEARLKDRIRGELLDPPVAYQLQFTLNLVEAEIRNDPNKDSPNAED